MLALASKHGKTSECFSDFKSLFPNGFVHSQSGMARNFFETDNLTTCSKLLKNYGTDLKR